MKKAIIDLDDVLSLDAFLNMLNYFNNSNYKYSDIKSYYVEEILPKERLIEYKDFFIKNNVYDFAIVAPHSKEVLKNLMLEYEIYITSSYYSYLHNDIIPELIPRKCEFLKKNYPFLSTKNFIFTNDKLMLEADLRIDDRLDNLGTNGINILYNAYHNENIEEKEFENKNILRVNDWDDIEEKVLKKSIYK